MAIQVSGTTVIDNSRVLQNVTGLKTINSTSILGSGDISTSSGYTWSSTQNFNTTVTGIPSTVREMVVVFNNLITFTSANAIMRIGDSGGIESSGYVNIRTIYYTSSVNTNASRTNSWDVGTTVSGRNTAGQLHLNSQDGKTWFISGGVGNTNPTNYYMLGHKTLSGTLDRIQVYPSTNSHQSGYWRVGYR